MNRRCFARFAVVCVTAALSCGSGGAAGDSPREIVAAIYRQSAGPDGKYQGESAFFDRKLQQRFFSASLRAALSKRAELDKKNRDEVGALDFDPVTSSQDPSVENLRIETIKQSADAASVAAKFLQFKKPTSVLYDLVKENGGWKVDDVKGGSGDDKWSVRKLLKSP